MTNLAVIGPNNETLRPHQMARRTRPLLIGPRTIATGTVALVTWGGVGIGLLKIAERVL